MAKPQKSQLTARQKRMLSDYQQCQHASAKTIEPLVSAIDSIESFYKALSRQDEIKAKALLMLMLRNWLTDVSNFDPVSGRTLYTGIIDFLDAVAKSVQDESPEGETKDRIYRIVSHSKEAVLAIMEHTRDKILREHAMLPIYAAREVDSNSVQWLSRQPGRTLREKLAGKPYMKAVRRRSSVDTAENRLLKTFLFRLEQILIERQNVLSSEPEDTCEELLIFIQRWLRTENTAEIGAWGNLPPNNTLLQDKRYRKVWDTWLWLQAIDEQIAKDSKRIHRDILSVIYWNTLSLLNHSARFRTVQQPVGLDYDDFSIVPELPIQGYLFSAMDNNPPAEEIPVAFNLKDNKWKLQVGEDKYLLQIVSGNLVIESSQGVKKKLKIEPTTLKEIPKTILSLVIDDSFEYSKPNNSQRIRLDSPIVDLCSIRPTFTNNAGSQTYLPFRLLQQRWTLDNTEHITEHVIDCAHTKAIALNDKIETISMRSLFLHSGALPDATKSSASMFFTKKLSEYLKADKLTYLVPDWGNDFDLEGIRKSVNFYFDESTPLPKSIAAVFAWQFAWQSSKTSKKFLQDRVRENDFVLVVDSFDGGISITPVQAIYQKELDEILPETQGMSWERHPTVIVPNRGIHIAMARNLDRNGCQTSEELLRLFGFDGLASDSGEVSFVKDDHWYHLPGSIREALTQDLDLNILSNYAISDCLNSTNRGCRGVGVFILPLEDTIRKPDVRMDYKWLGSAWSPIKGCLTLNRWQEEVGDIALWRDHLPELSIRIVRDGHFENFYLVKDATVTPQRGRTVNIPVEESFTLPAGQTHYSFPLQQGDGNKELQFVAYLKSPAFPLKKTTACKLKMTYTYGADDPYELKFIPLDLAEAGFKSIWVEWRSASESEIADLESLPVPDFPARKSWSDFQKYPKEDGNSFSDLLDWVERDLEKISDISHNGRVSGVISKWIDKGNDNIFCFIDDVFVHKSSLRLRKDQELPQQGEVLSFYKVKDSKGKLSAKDVTIGAEQPKECFLSKSLRFPVLTIWNHGHSLSESDVPEHFRNAIFEGTQNILSIIESENMPNTLKEELFFFLCCLHKDASAITPSRLLDAVKDKKLLRIYHKNIAFAIGDAELPWQQQLLKSLISPIDSEGLIRSITLEDLAIALWRSETLVFKLSEPELKKLRNDLFRHIKSDIQRLTFDIPEYRLQLHLEKGLTEIEAQKRERGYQTDTLCKHLELLLALLRSRGIEGEEFKMVFAPDNDLTKKYVTLVDDVSRIVFDSDIELNSRISLQIEKPEMFHNTPDLLYALRMYLTGDSGANTIVITGVSED